MRFWDSSAIVPLLVVERTSRTMLELLLEDSDIATWQFSRVEAFSALWRLSRMGDIDVRTRLLGEDHLSLLCDSWEEVSNVGRVMPRALELLERHALRAADVLQLAAALEFCLDAPTVLPFVCLDRRLATAARAEGFTVYP